MICVKQAFGAGFGEIFDDVGIFAAAVVALAGVAFGVFVGKDGACGFEDGAADEVLTGDHFEAFVLAFNFLFNLLGDLRVGGGERSAEVDGHAVILCHRFLSFFCGRLFGVMMSVFAVFLEGVLGKVGVLVW